MSTITIPTVEELLEQSAATGEFRAAVADFQNSGKANDRVSFGRFDPPVKVMRVVCGLLEAAPDLAIDSVYVEGRSGCSDYRGVVDVNAGGERFNFVWDCAWRAKEQGWTDYFGDPDQQRAAKSFGYRCFEKFEKTN